VSTTEHAGLAPLGTIWLTGLPAAGKTTLARATAAVLTEDGHTPFVLDGDELRATISADLGFGRRGREEQARRVTDIALMAADRGVVAIVALVSPFLSDRGSARARHRAAGVPFVEVHVATPAIICRERDPKGLWARAIRGELRQFTGLDGPYEPPAAAEVVTVPGDTPEFGAARVLAALHHAAGMAAR
jgi:adenylyl-sulfate kinase